MSAPYFTADSVTLYLGDCLDVLRTLPDASVDAVVTDPPAGISFMGRDWDGDLGGRDRWIAWHAERLAEAARVLRPGGHALVWALPRTSHWTAMAVEDAGLEIRDCVTHLFGCLTDDVEVLTEGGWKPGLSIRCGDPIAQWDPATSAISIAPVQETFRAPWRGDLVRLHNSDTDQALTPNHRVWHRGVLWKRWSDYRVREAAEISRRSPVRLPLAGLHDGSGIGGEDYAALLGWVWTEGGFDPSGTGVRIYQSSVNTEKVNEIAALMDRVGAHKRYDQARTYTRRNGERHDYIASTWYFSGDLARQVRRDLPGKHPTYGLLWQMTLAEKRAFLAAALAGDGSQGKTGAWTFYQNHEGDREWFATLLALVGWRGHNATRKAPRTGGSVSVSQRADTTLSLRSLTDDREYYEGDVWCVRVPTGAFVARRHGKVFITGNSGFPKSLDVGKAIDKAAGAERKVVGMVPPSAGGGRSTARDGWRRPWMDDESARDKTREITAPATAEAVRWDGWGTALKPAAEHWWLARKPLSGTVAASVLEHGTGALNIDATRVPAGQDYRDKCASVVGIDTNRNGDAYGDWPGARTDSAHQAGRWPTNVVFSHPPKIVDGDVVGDACASGCVDGCPVAELDRQSGITTSSGGKGEASRRTKSKDVYGRYANEGSWTSAGGLGDSGGASRFFPTFRYEAKAPASERPKLADGTAWPTVKPVSLMRWLVRLVTPPNGVVLDPFAGTGTTAEAALIEGFRALLIERDPQAAELIKARLAKPIAAVLDLEGLA